jgi:hypothetical protein
MQPINHVNVSSSFVNLFPRQSSYTVNAQGIEVECTDRKDSLDDERMILLQRPVVRLGEAHAQLLGGVGLVELERDHSKLKPAEQPHKRLSGRLDHLVSFSFEHSLEGFGIDGVGSKPCTNLLDVPIQVRFDRPKGRGTEEVCGTTMRNKRGTAAEDGEDVPNIFTIPLEASRNWFVSTPSSIGTSANDCRARRVDQHIPAQANEGEDREVPSGAYQRRWSLCLSLSERMLWAGSSAGAPRATSTATPRWNAENTPVAWRTHENQG